MGGREGLKEIVTYSSGLPYFPNIHTYIMYVCLSIFSPKRKLVRLVVLPCIDYV